jgi:hypothetical protein
MFKKKEDDEDENKEKTLKDLTEYKNFDLLWFDIESRVRKQVMDLVTPYNDKFFK